MQCRIGYTKTTSVYVFLIYIFTHYITNGAIMYRCNNHNQN